MRIAVVDDIKRRADIIARMAVQSTLQKKCFGRYC